MKKSILNLGMKLSRNEQQKIYGGSHPQEGQPCTFFYEDPPWRHLTGTIDSCGMCQPNTFGPNKLKKHTDSC